MDPTLLDATLAFLGQHAVHHLLLGAGIFFLTLEVHLPGSYVPSAIGVLFVALAMAAGYARGLVSPVEAGILALGLLLLALELVAAPGSLVLGASGGLLLIAACYLSLLAPRPTPAEMGAAAVTLLSCLLLSVAVPAAVVKRAGPRPSGPLVLGRTLDAGSAAAPPHHLVGKLGRTTTDCRPAGRAEFEGQVVPVLAEGELLPRGTAVVGLRARGGELLVSRAATA